MMDILEKLTVFVNALEKHTWANNHENRLLLSVIQSFINSLLSAYIHRPVTLVSLSLLFDGEDIPRELESLQDAEELRDADSTSCTGNPYKSLRDLVAQVKKYPLTRKSSTKVVVFKPSLQQPVSSYKIRPTLAVEDDDSAGLPEDSDGGLTQVSDNGLPEVPDDGLPEVPDDGHDDGLSEEPDDGVSEVPDNDDITDMPDIMSRPRRKRPHSVLNDDGDSDYVPSTQATKALKIDVIKAKGTPERKKKESNIQIHVSNLATNVVVVEPLKSKTTSKFVYSCSLCANNNKKLNFLKYIDLQDHIEDMHNCVPRMLNGPKIDNQQKLFENGFSWSCYWCTVSYLKCPQPYFDHVQGCHVANDGSSLSLACPFCPVRIAVANNQLAAASNSVVQQVLDHINTKHFVADLEEENVGDHCYTISMQNRGFKESKNKEEQVQPKQSQKFLMGRAKCMSECSSCGGAYAASGLVSHIKRCKREMRGGNKKDSLGLPDKLPSVSCPLCKDGTNAVKHSQLNLFLRHLSLHCKGSKLQCPQCDWYWNLELARNGSRMLVAAKVAMHFAMCHDLLAIAAKAVKSSTETAPKAANPSSESTESEENAISISSIANLLSSHDLQPGSVYTVQLAEDGSQVVTLVSEGSGQTNSITDAQQLISSIENLESRTLGGQAAASVPLHILESTKGAITQQGTNSAEPFPDEPVYYCMLCPHRPRYLNRKTFCLHMQHFHITHACKGQDMEISCPDCPNVTFSMRVQSDSAQHWQARAMHLTEFLTLHRMLHHFLPRPAFMQVKRCQSCQYETMLHHTFRFEHKCSATKESREAEEAVPSVYQCVLCPPQEQPEHSTQYVVFSKEADYFQHMQTEHMIFQDKRYSMKCEQCKYTVHSKETKKLSHYKRVISQFLNHMWAEHGAPVPCQEKVITCSLCAYKTTYDPLYMKHLQTTHKFAREKALKEENEELCENCSGLVKTDAFAEHANKCKQNLFSPQDVNAKVMCEFCGAVVTYDHYTKAHRQACLGRVSNAEKPHTCDSCDKSYYTRKQLSDHKVQTHNKSKAASCEVCLQTLRNTSALRRHMLHEHGIECPLPTQGDDKNVYMCELCVFSTTSACNLKSHQARKHNISKYKCSHCKHVSLSEQALSRHILRVHSNENVVANYCHTCLRQFSSPTAYNNHMYVKHGVHLTGREILKCEQCGFETVGMSLLKAHMKNHEVSNYPCPLCNKLFTNKLRLKNHTLRVHRSKQLQCNYCESKFHDHAGLQRHTARNHTHEVYKCDLCRYVTYTAYLYRNHLQFKHDFSFDMATRQTEVCRQASQHRAACKDLADTRSGVTAPRKKATHNRVPAHSDVVELIVDGMDESSYDVQNGSEGQLYVTISKDIALHHQ